MSGPLTMKTRKPQDNIRVILGTIRIVIAKTIVMAMKTEIDTMKGREHVKHVVTVPCEFRRSTCTDRKAQPRVSAPSWNTRRS